MPHSPLISKIRCPNPNKKKTFIMNRNYVIYIATREGVDFSPDYHPPTGIIEYDNRINLINNELKEINSLKNAEYIKYIQERPRSHGLFGNIDTENIVSLGNQLADMSKQRKCIYRGIISLSEQDALELGYTSKEKWELYLRSNMSILKKEFNIDIKDFCWVAAFHMEPTHPHCHYMFWDSSEKLHNNFIHPTKQHACREAFSKEIFQEEYKIATLEKTNSRDEILGFSKDINNELTDILKEMQIGMPSHFKNNDIKELADQLISFSQTLPTTGRLNYKFLPPDTKHALDQITARVLKFSAIQKEYLNYIEQNKVISNAYSSGTTKTDAIQKKQLADLNTRLGNQLLKTCKIILENRDFLAAYNPSSSEPGSPEWDYFLSIAPDSSYQDFPSSGEPGEPEWDYFLSIAPDSLDQDFPNSSEPDSPEWNYFLSIAPDSLDQDFPNSSEPDSPEWDYFLSIAPDSPDHNFPSSGEPGEPEWDLKWSNTYRNAMVLIYNQDTPNYEKAINLLQTDCIQGNTLAFLALGKIYGKELVPDPMGGYATQLYYTEAFLGFNELLQSPHYDCNYDYINYMLGKMYELGTGTPMDYEKAIKYYSASNNKYAQYSLGNMYLRGKGNPITQENKFFYTQKALELFKSSANMGNAYAAYLFAQTSETNNLLHSPSSEIYNMYEKALIGFTEMLEKQKNDNLMYKLGCMYRDGKGTNINVDIAFQHFEKAATTYKNENAKYSLAKMYLNQDTIYYNLPSAIKLLEEISKNDSHCSSFAQYTLGKLYAESKPESEYYNLEKGLELFKCSLSSDQIKEHSLFALGKLYSDSQNHIYNLDVGINYFTESAQLGNAFAQYRLGKHYLEDSSLDIPLALQYLNSAAEQDNDMALYMLGRFYSNKESSYHDLQAAIQFLETSADRGHSFSQCLLGKIYLDDNSLNIPLALKYLNLSAEQDNDMAFYTLGKFYSNKESSFYNLPTAIQFLEASADRGHSFSQCLLGKIYLDDNSLNIPLALKYLNLAAEQDNDMALYTLGRFYSNKESLYHDLQAAIQFLETSADRGHSFSQCLLGKIYLDDNSLNIPLALKYLNLSANQDNDMALYTLGQFYSSKELPSYDIHTAMHFLENSASKGNMYALAKLGGIYLWGAHAAIPKDVELGKKYLMEALSKGNIYAQETLNMYDNFCNNIIFRGVFKTALDCFYSISQQNRQTKFDSLFHSTDYRKLKAKHLNENHSQDNELN